MDTMKLQFDSSIENFTEVNESFASASLLICYTGVNQNRSSISRSVLESAIPTMYNCPVVCNYDVYDDSIGGHDVDLVKTDDGSIKLINKTSAVGVVPNGAHVYWVTKTGEDGAEHEYLSTDVIIWKRSPAYQKLSEDGVEAQSMEINVKSGQLKDGVFVIEDFVFTAFCLLGEGIKPCFEDAAIHMYQLDDVSQEFSRMMEEFKESFAMVQPSTEVVIDQNLMEGGEKVLDEKIALAAEFGIDVDSLDFALNDFTVDELREKFTAMTATPTDSEPAADPEPNANFALESQLRDELVLAVESEMVETSFGEMPKYYFVDYDKDASEVYAVDTTDWNLYGFAYSMDGDHAVIAPDSKQRMKWAVVPFDEGEQSVPFAGVFANAVEKYGENDAQWAEKYQAASDKIASYEVELGELRTFKQNAESAQAQAERDEVFSQFEDLDGVESFEELRNHALDFSIEDLEEKCYAIRGRNATKLTFSKASHAPKLKVDDTANKTPKKDKYNGVFEEYGIFPDNK